MDVGCGEGKHLKITRKKSRFSKKRLGRLFGGLFCALMALGSPETALSLNWQTKGLPTPFDQRPSLRVENHPFAGFATQPIRLFHEGRITFDQAVLSTLRGQGISSLFQLKSRPRQKMAGMGQASEFSFYAGGIALCEHRVVASDLPGGGFFMLGEAPALPSGFLPPALSDWPDREASQDLARHEFENMGWSHVTVAKEKTTPCLRTTMDDGLIPVWEMWVGTESGTYRLLVDESLIHLTEPLFFSATGTARTYKKNPRHGSLIDVALTNLEGNGTLSSKHLYTSNGNGGRAFAEDHQFIYEPGDPRFPEASAFAHASEMLDFFVAFGYQWHSPGPLRIVVNDPDFDASKIGGVYQIDANGLPEIRIGNTITDIEFGTLLVNLNTDADVILHEFSHHIIARTLGNFPGEPITVHEALADYFTFAKTKDFCLGESLCIGATTDVGKRVCQVPQECLRSAINTMKLTDSNLPEEPHRRSQFLSGMLADLSRNQGIAQTQVAATAYAATGLFTPYSGFRDVILGMMIADRQLFGGSANCTIYNTAVARGLQSHLTGIDCAAANLPAMSPVNVEKEVTNATTSTSTSKGKSACGTTAGVSTPAGIPFLMSALLTLTALFVRRRP